MLCERVYHVGSGAIPALFIGGLNAAGAVHVYGPVQLAFLGAKMETPLLPCSRVIMTVAVVGLQLQWGQLDSPNCQEDNDGQTPPYP